MKSPHQLVRACCRSLAIGFAVLLWLVPGCATATEVRLIKIVTIAVKPFGIKDVAGNKSGNVYDIGNLIVEEIGLPYENTIVPYPRALAMIESGEADLLIALPSERLSKHANQIAFVSSLENIVIGRSGTHFRTLEDLHGKVVGTVREAKYDAQFSADSNIKKYNVSNYEQGISMMFANRLDAMIGVKEGIFFALKSIGGKRDMLGRQLLLSRKDASLHFSKKTYEAPLAAALQDAVLRLQQRKAIKKIDEKYLGAFVDE